MHTLALNFFSVKYSGSQQSNCFSNIRQGSNNGLVGMKNKSEDKSTYWIKTGMLTFHCCINDGNYQRVRCKDNGLKLRGHNATIPDHYSRKVNIAEWQCTNQPVLPIVVPETGHLFTVKNCYENGYSFM